MQASYALTLELNEAASNFGDKIDILELNELQQSMEFVLRVDSPPGEAMLAMLRLLQLQGAQRAGGGGRLGRAGPACRSTAGQGSAVNQHGAGHPVPLCSLSAASPCTRQLIPACTKARRSPCVRPTLPRPLLLPPPSVDPATGHQALSTPCPPPCARAQFPHHRHHHHHHHHGLASEPLTPTPAGADSFLLESIFRNETWEHMQLPVSEENERACYQVIIDGCTAALAGYPTSIDEDLALLAR